MAELDNKLAPGDWNSTDDDSYARTEKLLQALQEESNRIKLSETIVGVVVQFPIADGYAWYRVIKQRPLTLQHIPICDAFQIPHPYLRGLRKSDIVRMVICERELNVMFEEA